MPYKEKKVEKLYYSIGEVSDMLDVPVSTVRFWENEFDILKPMKNKKGDTELQRKRKLLGNLNRVKLKKQEQEKQRSGRTLSFGKSWVSK